MVEQGIAAGLAHAVNQDTAGYRGEGLPHDVKAQLASGYGPTTAYDSPTEMGMSPPRASADFWEYPRATTGTRLVGEDAPTTPW